MWFVYTQTQAHSTNVEGLHQLVQDLVGKGGICPSEVLPLPIRLPLILRELHNNLLLRAIPVKKMSGMSPKLPGSLFLCNSQSLQEHVGSAARYVDTILRPGCPRHAIASPPSVCSHAVPRIKLYFRTSSQAQSCLPSIWRASFVSGGLLL